MNERVSVQEEKKWLSTQEDRDALAANLAETRAPKSFFSGELDLVLAEYDDFLIKQDMWKQILAGNLRLDVRRGNVVYWEEEEDGE
jgi:hypothetical protein